MPRRFPTFYNRPLQHPQTLAELKDLVEQGVEYFNTVEISSKRNNLTAEDFRNEAV